MGDIVPQWRSPVTDVAVPGRRPPFGVPGNVLPIGLMDRQQVDQVRDAVDTVLAGIESKNVMQVIGGGLELHRLLVELFGSDWCMDTLGRMVHIATSDSADWCRDNIQPMMSTFMPDLSDLETPE